MLHRFQIFSTLILFISLLSGCVAYPPLDIDLCPQLTLEKNPLKTDNNSIKKYLYIDESTSMQGFNSTTDKPENPNTRYGKIIDILKNSFPDKPPINRGKYNNNFYRIIQAFIDSKNTGNNEVIAVVTDLFKRADQAGILKKHLVTFLKDSPNLAIGVVGIRSEFSGIIPAKQVLGAVVDYNYQINAKGDIDKFRPFYIIILGNKEQVRETIKQIAFKIQETNVHLQNENTFIPLIISQDYWLQASNIRLPDAQADLEIAKTDNKCGNKLYYISKDKKEVKINVNFDIDRPDFALPLRPASENNKTQPNLINSQLSNETNLLLKEIQANIKAQKYTGRYNEANLPEKITDPNAASSLKLAQVNLSENTGQKATMQAVFSLETDQLPSGSYVYKISLMLPRNLGSFGNLKTWNMGNKVTENPQECEKGLCPQDLGKTPNLIPFLGELWNNLGDYQLVELNLYIAKGTR